MIHFSWRARPETSVRFILRGTGIFFVLFYIYPIVPYASALCAQLLCIVKLYNNSLIDFHGTFNEEFCLFLLAMYILFYLCVMGCYATVSVPYNGLIADQTPSAQRGEFPYLWRIIQHNKAVNCLIKGWQSTEIWNWYNVSSLTHHQVSKQCCCACVVRRNY